MPRKPSEEYLYDEVDHILDLITDQLLLTWDELFEVAERWCKKDYTHHHEKASTLNVMPGSLLLTAMLYVEHPLLVSPGRGIMYNFMKCHILLIAAEMKQQDLAVPIKKPIIHNVPVD